MASAHSDPHLPDFVSWPIFPFVGEMRVRPVEPRREADWPRDGEPGDAHAAELGQMIVRIDRAVQASGGRELAKRGGHAIAAS